MKLLVAQYICTKAPPTKKSWSKLALGYLSLTILALTYWSLLNFARPEKELSKALFKGVYYTRQVFGSPPTKVHTLAISLKERGIKPMVTSALEINGSIGTFAAQSTTKFLESSDSKVAINGGYFDHSYTLNPLLYHPHAGDEVYAHGLVIADGQLQSSHKPGLPVLCISKEHHASFARGSCPRLTTHALGGAMFLVRDGLIQFVPNNEHREPQSAVCTTSSGEELLLIVVDGRQSNYSEGMSSYELAEYCLSLGCEHAMSLDGGGSSTLAISTSLGPRLLNVPIAGGIPFRQRHVATHLGFQALPLEPNENQIVATSP